VISSLRPSRSKELALVALAACAFATASPIAKSIGGLSFAGIGAGRCAVAAVALLAISPVATWRALRALDARRRLALVGAGLLLGAHFGLFLAGLLATSLPAASALVALEPIAVVVAAWMAFGVRPRRREMAGIAIATLGAAVVSSGAGQGEHRLLGDALVLAAVVIFGAYVAFARGLRDALPTTPYAACVYTVAALALAPLVLVFDARAPAIPSSTWLGVAALGLVPTLIGHTLVQRAARHVSPSLVALASPGETVGAILIGAALGHLPTPIEWTGAAVVVAGAVVTVTGTTM
jgi:drug/metabolite transporter (DMT)-like permease